MTREELVTGGRDAPSCPHRFVRFNVELGVDESVACLYVFVECRGSRLGLRLVGALAFSLSTLLCSLVALPFFS